MEDENLAVLLVGQDTKWAAEPRRNISYLYLRGLLGYLDCNAPYYYLLLSCPLVTITFEDILHWSS